ncbi:MAG: amidohydrolase family protein, partial [Actinomycetota bacterium]|nr:amidohydrolase family protein [Actinomycetota bacterium]
EFVGGGPAGGWHPEEKIGLEEALDAYTRGSAYAEFTEDAKGTLAPGMLADLVVFGGNIFDGPPSHLLNTPVEMTVVGGRVVYEKK